MADSPDPEMQSTRDLANQKARLEVAKLEAETRSLKRPNIGIWVTALVGLIGIGLQYALSDQKYQAAEIKKEKAELDFARLEIAKGHLDTLVRQTRTALDSLQATRSRLEDHLKVTREALAAAERQVGQLAVHDTARRAAARDAITQASRSVYSLDSALKQSQTVNDQARGGLGVIQAEVTNTGLSPGSPVVATIHVPYRAQLTYRRWMSPNVVVDAGIVDSGETPLTLPYGGYMYFDARNVATGQVTRKAADCSHACRVEFF